MTPRGIALLLPGGTIRSTRPAFRYGLASLRMLSFQRSLEQAGVDTALVSYRLRGWNDGDPLPDAMAAIATARARGRARRSCWSGTRWAAASRSGWQERRVSRGWS